MVFNKPKKTPFRVFWLASWDINFYRETKPTLTAVKQTKLPTANARGAVANNVIDAEPRIKYFIIFASKDKSL